MSRLAAGLALALLAIPAAPATAQEAADARDEEARGLFQAGRAAFDDERYEDALDYFERAHALSPRPTLLYNVGLAAERAGHPERARQAWERLLREEPDSPVRAEVEGRLRALPSEPGPSASPPAEAPVERTGFRVAPPLGAVAVTASGAAIVATGAVILALGGADAREVRGADAGTTWEELRPVRDDARRRWAAGQALLYAGAAITVGGVAWLALGDRGNVEIAIGPAGASLRGRF